MIWLEIRSLSAGSGQALKSLFNIVFTTATTNARGISWSAEEPVSMDRAEAAGFLSRDEADVRKKAKQMKIPYGRLRHYSHYRVRRGA